MKAWLITGCSSGSGQRRAFAAAQRGNRVIAERKLAAFRSDLNIWREVSIATDCDQS